MYYAMAVISSTKSTHGHQFSTSKFIMFVWPVCTCGQIQIQQFGLGQLGQKSRIIILLFHQMVPIKISIRCMVHGLYILKVQHDDPELRLTCIHVSLHVQNRPLEVLPFRQELH